MPIVPYTIHWDLWIGPSPYRPYHPDYAPFAWRGRWDFGSGSLGDMGSHIMDQPYWALELGMPEQVHASSTPFNSEAFPIGSSVHYKFLGNSDRGLIELNWYDGGLMSHRTTELADGKPMGAGDGGLIFYGTEGMLMADVYGENARFIPASDINQIGQPEKTMERSPGIHEEWVAAAKGNGETSSNFKYASALTETMLLGNMAIRFSDSHNKLQWAGDNMRVKNLKK